MLPIGVMQQQSGGAVYNPGMMTFNGTNAYYSKTGITTTGNKFTAVARVNISSYSGDTFKYICAVNGATYQRIQFVTYSNDYTADATMQDTMNLAVLNSSGALICILRTESIICDGADHVVWFAFDGDAGSASLYVDGVAEDDLTYGSRVAPTAGTLDSSASSKCAVAAYVTAAAKLAGQVGYFGYRDALLANPTDFYHPTNGLQELDEAGWTEWGAQPLFWNKYGQMTDNKGSAGNMTANGTITGPA